MFVKWMAPIPVNVLRNAKLLWIVICCRKRWLKYTGSRMSKIEKAEFRNEKNIDDYTLNEFKVRH
jgi:hypothetical protein